MPVRPIGRPKVTRVHAVVLAVRDGVQAARVNRPRLVSATMTVTLVVAIGRNGVIGRDGGLPWAPTGDLRRFKALTLGHPMVMGRRTYESIGRPLPGRTTIVVTRDRQWTADGVLVSHSVDDALAAAAALDDEVFVVGGAEVYRQTLPFADRLVVTWVEQEPTGDTVFPDVDWTRWQETGREPHDGYSIVSYEPVA